MPLHRFTSTSRLVSKVMEIQAGVSWSIGTASTKTEVTAYVIEGVLQLAIAGSEEVLNPGDCLVLDTDTASLWTAQNESDCRILVVFARTAHAWFRIA